MAKVQTVDWGVIETHWQDLLRVVLSIKAGKVSSAVLLRKLGNYSRKNRLYQAFRELKRTFDPQDIFNPGKIVDAPPLMSNS